MPGNSRVTEPERLIRASSPISVSSPRMSSLQRTSIWAYQAQNQKSEALEQQMNEISVLLAHSGLRSEKLLARALAQLQSMSVEVHFERSAVSLSYSERRRSRTNVIAYKRHGGGRPNYVGHRNHGDC